MSGLPATMALLRGLHLAATLSLLGTAGFVAWMLPAAAGTPAPLPRRLNRLGWLSGLIAVLAGAAWFTLQAAAIADADTVSDVLDALPAVAAHTRFGTLAMARLGLLILATGLAWRGLLPSPRVTGMTNLSGSGCLPLYLTVVLTAAALGLQGLIGHAGAAAGAIGDGLVASEALHLIAAGVWLGALVPLGLGLLAVSPAQAVLLCERFTPIGLACVVVLAGTGVAQGMDFIGGVPALVGTRYGHIALLKIALFLFAIVLAALNRLWLTDRLGEGAEAARGHLLLSVCAETGAGLAIIAAAAFMASSPPAAHTIPVWPFSWRISLTAVDADTDLRREVITSLLLIGGAVVLMAGALLWRRFRMLALAILLASVLMRGASLGLLTVEAYPTSFQTSPAAFSAAAISRGQMLYGPYCASCHGPEGDGNGQAAAGLRIKPADLTLPHLWEHTDGEMFWWLTHGIDNPEGGLAMPGFADSLPAEDRWALIDYIRAHNAGVAMRRDSELDSPVRAPGFPLACDGVAASRTTDLLGRAVHVVADEGAIDQPPIPPQAGIATITLVLREDVTPPPGSCASADRMARIAYAVLADRPPDRLWGTEFLVDSNGWLRAISHSATDGWRSRAELIAAIREMNRSPIKLPREGDHGHHH